jgi:hypothetical protein
MGDVDAEELAIYSIQWWAAHLHWAKLWYVTQPCVESGM